MVSKIVEQDASFDHLPDYSMVLDGDCAVFRNKGTMMKDDALPPLLGDVRVSESALEKARAHAPGWDIYHLENEWRSWMSDGGLDAPMHLDKAFVGFCQKWFDRHGKP